MASGSPPPKPSSSRTLDTQPLCPLTSKLSATASSLPHSAWRPYSCPDLPDGELGLCFFHPRNPLPAIFLPRTLASTRPLPRSRFIAKYTPRATF